MPDKSERDLAGGAGRFPAPGSGSAPSSAASGFATRAGRLLGLDRHIVGTLLLRGWTIFAGSLMIVLIPLWLSRTEQGYYYTFASLLALQIFFELGMNQIVVQLVGHEVAHVSRVGRNVLPRDPIRLARLISLTRMLGRWYLIASLLFAIIAGLGGTMFFALQPELPSSGILIVWGMLTVTTAGNLYLSPWLAVLEGLGEVARVARLRLVQSVIGYGLTIVALVAGARLYAVPILSAAALLCTGLWIWRREPALTWLRRDAEDGHGERLSWRRDVFPFQWRIAVSWVSGYFIMQLFVPMTFAHRGAVEAGRLGMAISLFNAALTIGLSWVNAKLPVMSGQIARDEHSALNRVFHGAFARSTAAVALGCAAIFVGSLFLPDTLRARLASTTVMGLLAISTIMVCVNASLATYMRAHKEEPMLALSIVVAAMMAPTVFLASRTGVAEMMGVYVAILALVAVPWTLLIFRRYLRRHAS